MDGFAYWPIFSIGISVISAAILLYMQVRNGKDKLSSDTLKKYQEALEIRETTIHDLQEKIDQKDKLHAEQMNNMQAQITALQTQIANLTSKNKMLEDAVTGKVYLEKVIQMLSAFQPLIAKDGILQEFQKDHAETKIALDDIKNSLHITKRHEDSHGTTTTGD